MARDFKLTEEVARWAFEIICQQDDNWHISFTNPTAGPWKTIKCSDENGNEGEVYRFELEETRPDILLVNDAIGVTLIIEAKDSIEKLVAGDQVEKSVAVVGKLSEKLQKMSTNHFWGERAKYPIVTGILWGSENGSTKVDRKKVFNKYHDEIKKYDNIESGCIIGTETRRSGDGVKCFSYSSSYSDDGELLAQKLLNSFNVIKNGELGGTRTLDTLLKRQML